MSVIAGAVIFAAAVISVGAIWMLVVIGFGDAAVTVEVDVTIARDVFAIAARRLERELRGNRKCGDVKSAERMISHFF